LDRSIVIYDCNELGVLFARHFSTITRPCTGNNDTFVRLNETLGKVGPALEIDLGNSRCGAAMVGISGAWKS
jgi:hypothetical protein